MLIYQYPPRMSEYDRKVSVLTARAEDKNNRKKAYKNFAMAAIIIAIAVFSKAILVIALLSVIAAYVLFLGLMIIRLSGSAANDKIKTRVYDDKITHVQQNFFSGNLTRYKINFDDITESYQDNLGNLILLIKNDNSAITEGVNKDGKFFLKDIKSLKIKLNFAVPDAKYFMINNIPESIKYKKV